jgi:hypothetical protein
LDPHRVHPACRARRTVTGAATFTLALYINGGALTSGSPVVQPIALRGQQAVYTFTGTSGQHVTFDVGASNWGGGIAYLRLFRPAGTALGNVGLGTGPTQGTFTLDATGTWTVRILATGPATGSVTFTLLP